MTFETPNEDNKTSREVGDRLAQERGGPHPISNDELKKLISHKATVDRLIEMQDEREKGIEDREHSA